jgi:AcrR family transcriptional regulator
MPRHADPKARESLIAAARAEFARKGLRGARIEDITAACGLSKGAFYLHFETKEALFGELVDTFLEVMNEEAETRRARMTSFLKKHGPVTRRDVTKKSARYRELLEAEAQGDLRLLEHLWANRDVVGVLLRGAQGTTFEGFIWALTDTEVERCKEDFERFQGAACRQDLPPEIIGSMIVGTYLLLAMRMSRMQEKPDLAEWAHSLHTLIREGTAPIEVSNSRKSARSLS